MKVKDLLPQIYGTLGSMAYAGDSAEQVANTEVVIGVGGEELHVDSLTYNPKRDKIVLSAIDKVD